MALKLAGNDNANSGKLGTLCRNMPQLGLSIVEPEPNEEFTKDKEAVMASLFANCKRTWLESLKRHLGYQLDYSMDYGALNELQPFPINNFGDPFMKTNYGVNSKAFEVGVLDWFAQLWEADKVDYWGYIASGGTEANLQTILMGREMFPDGMLYASKESHYSISKAVRMYRMDLVQVETLASGEMDYADFKTKLVQNKDRPAIVIVNIGTTFKGAVDDPDLVIQTLEECGFSRTRYYIHCDGALSGLIVPFIEQAPKKISFKKAIDSISVSGHKFLGCPNPCGVLITRKDHVNILSRDIEYIAVRDATISGSRNGHTSILLWYILNRKGHRGLRKDVKKCLDNARYLKNKLEGAGVSVMLNELSITVLFERPRDEEFIHRWQLSCEGNIAKVVVMPNVTVEKLDVFLEELVEKRSSLFIKNVAHQPLWGSSGWIGNGEYCTSAVTHA